jgi:type IV pilus assembly protein PilV
MTKFRKMIVRTGQKGFTLLEALVAMIILAIGILGLAPMLVLSMQGNQFSRDVTDAAYLAQGKIEQLKNQFTISPIPFSETTNSGVYTRTVNVSDQTIDSSIPPGVYRISVTVTWTDKEGKGHSANYLTYKVK